LEKEEKANEQGRSELISEVAIEEDDEWLV